MGSELDCVRLEGHSFRSKVMVGGLKIQELCQESQSGQHGIVSRYWGQT